MASYHHASLYLNLNFSILCASCGNTSRQEKGPIEFGDSYHTSSEKEETLKVIVHLKGKRYNK